MMGSFRVDPMTKNIYKRHGHAFSECPWQVEGNSEKNCQITRDLRLYKKSSRVLKSKFELVHSAELADCKKHES